MSYICDYTKFVNHIEMADEMTPDMCCDGCAKRCRISLQMTLNTNYSIGDKIQTVCIEPAMFAGDKKLDRPGELCSGNLQARAGLPRRRP